MRMRGTSLDDDVVTVSSLPFSCPLLPHAPTRPHPSLYTCIHHDGCHCDQRHFLRLLPLPINFPASLLNISFLSAAQVPLFFSSLFSSLTLVHPVLDCRSCFSVRISVLHCSIAQLSSHSFSIPLPTIPSFLHFVHFSLASTLLLLFLPALPVTQQNIGFTLFPYPIALCLIQKFRIRTTPHTRTPTHPVRHHDKDVDHSKISRIPQFDLPPCPRRLDLNAELLLWRF